jgi:hypothetical protein
MPGIDDMIGKAPPEWLDNIVKKDSGTGRLNFKTQEQPEPPSDPVVLMNLALDESCPFCKTKSLQRYDVERSKVRCTVCDIIMSIGIVYSRQ